MRSASITQPEVRSQILTAAEKLFRSYGYGKTCFSRRWNFYNSLYGC